MTRRRITAACIICCGPFVPRNSRELTCSPYCSKAWIRQRDQERPKRPRPRLAPEERFWRYVDKRSANECWNWRGGKSTKGYGRFRLGGKADGMIGPHRFSYEIANGKVADDLLICHHCDNPSCVNPAHLFVGTQSDNLRDAHGKGRTRGVFQVGFDPRRRPS